MRIWGSGDEIKWQTQNPDKKPFLEICHLGLANEVYPFHSVASGLSLACRVLCCVGHILAWQTLGLPFCFHSGYRYGTEWRKCHDMADLYWGLFILKFKGHPSNTYDQLVKALEVSWGVTVSSNLCFDFLKLNSKFYLVGFLLYFVWTGIFFLFSSDALSM